MPGDRVSVATLPDQGSAKMVADMLRDNGVDDVDVRGVPGVAYVPRASVLDWVVSVMDEDEARAKLLLADFETESAQAAVRQASDVELAPHDDDDDEEASPSTRKRPWVFWVAMAAVLVFAIPFLINVLGVVFHFLYAFIR